ncbi:sensor histidine kinase [Dyadobacter subterraneus]|uniref:sensor histidine kinase n=1 Tax=Dyadobacter subterraneus TaxID=2773304 RepID=UPI001D16D377|nr:HAMP domain-containing sensor histidine kinase [Dyadobacter subterraneus]
MIFLMSLTCWHCIVAIQKNLNLALWQKIALSLLCCCALSNIFFFTFNPIFKDFPFRTATNPLFVRILMLSSRGVLMSIILIPGAYYVQKDLEARTAQKEKQKLAMQKVQIQNRLLENAVLERTRALHQSLVSVQNSQKELEHQLYIQSRLLASFNHDIKGPFKFAVTVSEKIAYLAAAKEDSATIQRYADELSKSLKNMLVLIKNNLDFVKLPVKQHLETAENIILRDLIEDKASVFEGSILTNKNILVIKVDPTTIVQTNKNLLGIIVHNLIDNANKYTIEGSIKIHSTTTDDFTLLTISNPGIEISSQIVAWINMKTNTDNTITPSDLTEIQGIGLLLVKEIAGILNIGLHMYSDPEGIHVALRIPTPGENS